MKLLLDTNAFLFWVDGSPRLTGRARRAIENEAHTCFVSLVTAWELAIKVSIGKLTLATPVGRYFAEHVAVNMFDVLGIELAHVAAVEKLPQHHGDPFDRLLLGQALSEKLTIVSSNPVFAKYGLKPVW